MSLRISLRNGERVIINGAVLRSVGRTDVIVENSSTVLRGRDVMKPEDANTPARRLYFACMMAYIDQDNREKHQQSLLSQLEALVAALEAPEAKAACLRFAEKIALEQFYAALSDARWLFHYEAEVLGRSVDD